MPLKRRRLLRRTPLRRRSAKGQARLDARRRRMRAVYGYFPDCDGRAIIPACPVTPHLADTAHEPRKRSHGADETDPAQGIPLCDAGHRWVHDHPRQAAELTARDGRPFLLLGNA